MTDGAVTAARNCQKSLIASPASCRIPRASVPNASTSRAAASLHYDNNKANSPDRKIAGTPTLRGSLSSRRRGMRSTSKRGSTLETVAEETSTPAAKKKKKDAKVSNNDESLQRMVQEGAKVKPVPNDNSSTVAEAIRSAKRGRKRN